ncbi:uncharacterized protein LY89DRAFT_623574 [Mollisia scopiformis]|uniref:Uncharacterized protein n=1 Tax=Mollisia scopiformis TaxID=149040 RepID=A0A194WWQ9_MOLSC|nr:uncharacterized protein LY89DRAFT_623574 [Mollisia scopiformis]KUJ12416.1 hypothetical protein LY89DRAFT_623574 [Mollisia scopiformis]
MMQLILSWVLLAILAIAPRVGNALPTVESSLAVRTPSLPLTVNVLHTFEFPSWCENLAVQANGRLLVSRLDTPEVIQVDPTGVLAPTTVASWNASEYMGCLGISETVAGVFYVITSAFVNDIFVKTSGVNSIWEINMNTFNVSSAGVVTSNATVSKLVDIESADFLNGMITLNAYHILVGDVYNGWVYKVNTITGRYYIAINDPLMKFGANATTNLGVNGLKIHSPYLYWTNTAVGSLNRILINAKAEPYGVSQVVTANVPKADDFIFKSDGTAFIAQNQEDELSVLLSGQSVAEVVAGNNISTTLAGVTAGKFGRLSTDANRLYLTTSGALGLPINGSVVVAGSVLYIDTTGF